MGGQRAQGPHRPDVPLSRRGRGDTVDELLHDAAHVREAGTEALVGLGRRLELQVLRQGGTDGCLVLTVLIAVEGIALPREPLLEFHDPGVHRGVVPLQCGESIDHLVHRPQAFETGREVDPRLPEGLTAAGLRPQVVEIRRIAQQRDPEFDREFALDVGGVHADDRARLGPRQLIVDAP